MEGEEILGANPFADYFILYVTTSMKKFYLLLLLGVLSTHFCSESLAQTKIYKLHFTVSDKYNNSLTDSIHFSFRNSDSSTTSSSPYASVVQYYNGSSVYDSGTVATNYTDSAITIRYKACGQWFTLDTFFSSYHNSFFSVSHISVYIKAPCFNPCSAAFSYTTNQNALEIHVNPHDYSGPFTYHWYFGDGKDTFTQSTLHTYAAPGNYTLSLVILDTFNNCTDSSSQLISISPQCSPVFYSNHDKYGYVNINVGNNAYPGFQHTWIIGDSIFTNDGTNFTYRFGAGGFKLIKYIVEYPGQCKDSMTRQVTTHSCQTELAGHQVSFRKVTLQPVNNTDTFSYDFGDGSSAIAVGPVSHTYAMHKTYQLKIVDLHGYCYQKYFSVTTNQDCSNAFGSQVDSLFKMSFFVTQSYTYNVRRIIHPIGDTLFGNTTSYIFPSRGYYWIDHQLTDSVGNVYCSYYENVEVSSCGVFGWMNIKDYIMGKVRFNSNRTTAYDSLIVYLIEHDSVAATLTAVDSLVLYSNPNDSGYFEFFHLCDINKNYLVKAALLPGSGIYANYLPTYYRQSASWSGATTLSPYNYIILNMLTGTNLGGPGFIGGYISQGANKKFNPLEGIQVTVFDKDDVAIDFRTSDANGHYEFASLPYGTYRVTVEILGKPSDSYMITLNASYERAEEQDFEVNSTYISTLHTAIHLPQLAGRIYPNPANDAFFIEWTKDADEYLIIEFYTLDGKKKKTAILERNGELISEIQIADLPAGLYILKVSGAETHSSLRLQKN